MVETRLASSKSVAKSEKKNVCFDSDFVKGKECEVKMGRKSVCKSDKKGKKPELEYGCTKSSGKDKHAGDDNVNDENLVKKMEATVEDEGEEENEV